MPNDHYIPRMLTVPWEFGERRLRYFDYCLRSFGEEPSRTMFALRDLNSAEVELWTNRVIETPSGAYISRLRQGDAPTTPTDWRVTRGLALLLFLNSQRIQEAVYDEPAALTLSDFCRAGEKLADDMAALLLQHYRLVCLQLPDSLDLFFTEMGTFPFPMPERPVTALPLGLRHVLLAYDGPMSTQVLLKNIDPRTLAQFSIGVGPDVHRVLLPPSWRDASVANEDDVASRLMEARLGLRQIFNLVGRASVRVGLRGWAVTE